MKKKTIFKLILIIIFLVVLGAGYYFLFSNREKPVALLPDPLFGWKFPVSALSPSAVPSPLAIGSGKNLFDFQIAYSSIRDPGGLPQGLPVRLQIPIIGVDSAIEDALITPDGRMDVPAGSVDVAWFALGPHPGQVGSAVIGGHFGIKNGVKFVFYDLDKLVVGDKVYILNDEGDTLAFQVRRIQLFDRNADATTVFTSNDGLAHLNLITCEGVWNQVDGAYPSRRVVFTDAIAGNGAAPVNISISPVFQFNQTLSIGAQGADVTTLQTALKQEGFLASSSIVDGSFGKITGAGVAKFQASVGLKPDGVFGPLTKARFLSQLASKSGIPVTGVETNAINLSSSPQAFTFTVFLKSLFATPIDGIVTILLLLAIIFMVFKIIFR